MRKLMIVVLSAVFVGAGMITFLTARHFVRLRGHELFKPKGEPRPLPSLFMEELTWVEVRQALEEGRTSVIIPTGGIEQNGPHMILGKHNFVVRRTAGRIAEKLGNALVAPVVAYVPQGALERRSGHMRFPGTISIPDEIFEGVLEYIVRSLKLHGFKTFYFLGDSHANQAPQEELAQALTYEFRGEGVRVFSLGDYYGPENLQVDWLKSQGEHDRQIGTHAGIRDTSELMAVYPQGIRKDLLKPDGGGLSRMTGVVGDPTRASVERGKTMLDLKVQAALKQIEELNREG